MNTLFHGGTPGLWPGSLILPNMAYTRYLDNCPQCEAQRAGMSVPGFDPPTPHGFVYATADKEYARYYASRAGKGWLYTVELTGDVQSSDEDPFPTWRAQGARVIKVLEKRIVLTMAERKNLWLRWGGTDAEFDHMINKLKYGIQLKGE
jgi:hypothetical protein